MGLEHSYPDLFSALKQVIPSGIKVYLVGGAVRDVLLNREIEDFDFCVEGLVRPIGRKLADRLNGKFYMMDEDREIARVICPEQGYQIDLAKMAGTIEEDLRARDFTINAIAIEIGEANKLVDPLGGVSDLRNKTLRMCTHRSLQEDPLRSARAVRMSLEHGLRMNEELIGVLKEISPLMKNSSLERYRDELLKTLELNKTQAMLSLYEHFGFTEFFFPGVEKKDPGSFANALNHLITLLTEPFREELNDNAFSGYASLRIGEFRGSLKSFYDDALNSYHTRRILLNLAGLLAVLTDDPKTAAGWLKRLALSGDEVSCVTDSMKAYALLKETMQTTKWDNVAIYRYFNRFHGNGLNGIILYLSDLLSQEQNGDSYASWKDAIETSALLINAWFNLQETVVSPEPLIRGDEILSLLNIAPGPRVGELKTALIEAQIRGDIKTGDEAVCYLKTL